MQRIKFGDTKQIFQFVFTDAAGAPLNLTGATVAIRLADAERLSHGPYPCTVGTAASGIVTWAPPTTDDAPPPGFYYAELIATFSTGVAVHPAVGYEEIQITEPLVAWN